MDAVKERSLAGSGMIVAEIDPQQDALRCEGLCKYFTASKSKDELGPAANKLQGFWRKLRPPKKRKTAVDNVTLKLKRGEIFGVVGHNGSGKSTLIRMISTLLTPDQGTIDVFGFDPVQQPYQVQRLLNR